MLTFNFCKGLTLPVTWSIQGMMFKFGVPIHWGRHILMTSVLVTLFKTCIWDRLGTVSDHSIQQLRNGPRIDFHSTVSNVSVNIRILCCYYIKDWVTNWKTPLEEDNGTIISGLSACGTSVSLILERNKHQRNYRLDRYLRKWCY